MRNPKVDGLFTIYDRATKNRNYSEIQRSQWRDYRNDVRVEKRNYNSEREDKAKRSTNGYLFIGEDSEEKYNSGLAGSRKALEMDSTEVIKPPKVAHMNYHQYLRKLPKYFKQYEKRICVVNVDREIELFIRTFKLGDFGISVSDVVEDLHNNSIEYIFDAYDRYIELLKYYFEGNEDFIVTAQ